MMIMVRVTKRTVSENVPNDVNDVSQQAMALFIFLQNIIEDEISRCQYVFWNKYSVIMDEVLIIIKFRYD